MILFELFKRKEKSEDKPKITEMTTDFKTQLDIVEKDVFAKMKPLGFKKNGRTFNRQLDNGIIQVINFQSGQYPLTDNYEIPGLRENLYGKFVVNMGVCVENLFKFQFPTENKKYYKEYDCQIRTRLGTLLTGQDYWWKITDDNTKITEEIILGLETIGYDWFVGVDTKEKIINNLGNLPYDCSPRVKLDVALIVWFDNKEKGENLIMEYYNSIGSRNKAHKDYVKDLAAEIGIEV